MTARGASGPPDAIALRTELLGAALVFALGAALHFAFDSLGGWRPAALVAAVNESVWEHLKIAFWPGVVWAATRPAAVGPRAAAYWAARAIGLLIVSIVIVAVFYGYTAALGRNLLALDIGTFGLAILLGHLAFRRAVALAERDRMLRMAGGVLLAAQIAAFALFTYFPPPLPLFQDSRNGLSGFEAHTAGRPSEN